MNKHSLVCMLFVISAVFSGCDFGSNPEQKPISLGNKVIVAVTAAIEYTGGGNLGLYSIDNNSVQKNVLSIHSDNNVRIYDTTVYLIERSGKDNVIMINGHNISEAVVDNQMNIKEGFNIHDIAFVNKTKAYITAHGGQDLICYDPQSGNTTGKKISLEQFSHPESKSKTPKMDEALSYQGKVYIGLQKFTDDFISIDSGSIAVINSGNDSVEKQIILRKDNPQGMCIFGNKLYVACTGMYNSVSDGGIVSVDLATETLKGTVIDESSLGGNVSDVVIVSETKGYAIVADQSFKNFLVSFSPSSGVLISSRIDAAGEVSDFLCDEGKLYIACRSPSTSGIIVLNTKDDNLLSGPHDVGLPPNKIALLSFKD